MRKALRRYRNSILASPRFHAFSRRFWPFRWQARREARRVFNLVAGFTYSQTLAACVELELLQQLQRGDLDFPALYEDQRLGRDAWDLLVGAAKALDLIEIDADRIALGATGAVILADPGIVAMIRHHAAFYRDLADPVSMLQRPRGRGELAEFWPYAGRAGTAADHEGAAANYSSLMAASQPMVASEVLDAWDFGRYKHHLDIGGGDGSFVRAVRLRHPQLQSALFDRPKVAAIAASRFRAEPLPGTAVATHGGDFLSDELPATDLVTLVRIIHDHDDAVVLALLRNIRRAIEPGGTLIVAEPMTDTPGAPEMAEVYFRFYLHAMGTGRPRSAREISDLLCSAGFSAPQQVKTRLPIIAQVIVATT